MTITRAEFERLVDHLIERCREPVVKALKDAKLSPSQIDEVVLVGGSTRVPKVQELVRKIFDKEPHKGVNPDEVVAVGAAVQGAIIAGDVKDVVLLDVTPLSLGIETEGGVMTVLVERNTTIPTEKKEIFSTAADNQTAVTVKVFQGERKMANDNRLLGQFNLEGIPPAPRGVPQIQVAFSLDVNGILNVSAKEMGSGKEQKVRIEQSGGLSKDEIERMKRDADSHADEDARKRKLAEARNEAHRRIYDTEKLLKEHADKIDGSSKSAIEAAIEKVKSKSEGDDPAAIDQAVQELMQAAQAFAQHMQSQGGPGSGEGAKSSPQEDVIDAEFEKKD